LRAVAAPVLLLTGARGWPWPRDAILGRALCVEDLEHHHLADAGHHLHLDEGTAPLVRSVLADWLARRARELGGEPAAAAAAAGGLAARHAARERARAASAPPLWSPRHLYIASTAPLAHERVRAALPPADARRLHAFDLALLVDAAAPGLDAALVWRPLPDAAVGLPAAHVLRRHGVDVAPGAFLPRCAVETMPALDTAFF
jgi:hypothetical protein